MKTGIAAACCLLLAACSPSAPTAAGGAAADAPAAAASVPAVAAMASVDSAMPASAGHAGNVAPPPPPPMPLVALDGEGLRLVNRESGATRLLAFGTDVDGVLGALGSAMLPPGERFEDECGGTVLGFATLQLHTRDGKFLGWGLPDGSRLTTMSGVGLGTPRAAVAATSTIDMLEGSTLGEEFSIGGVAGLFASGAPDARVTHLWAGETCIAR